MKFIKSKIARFPPSTQNVIKRIYYRRQIHNNTFITSEPEYGILHSMVGTGDWVIDIGANIGHYTKLLSDLVGTEGRVIAFEPVSETFAILAANVQYFQFQNVTLINAAVSDKISIVGMNIPSFDTGLKNFFRANVDLNSSNISKTKTITLRLDLFQFPNRITLVKIDTEGHEMYVLQGMLDIIHRDHPVLIIETGSSDILNLLKDIGYIAKKLPDSPNLIFLHSQPL